VPGFPILDLERDPPKRLIPWFRSLFGLALGGALGWVLSNEPVFDSVVWIPVFVISVALHEIGHLAVGKLVGMDPGGIAICGLVIIRSGANWRCRFDWRLIMGGFAKPLPKKSEFDPRRYSWMVAAGPLATLLLAAISGVAWQWMGKPIGWVSSFLWVNTSLVILSLLPLSTATDGARLWMLMRNPERARRWMAMLQLMAQDSTGVLPRDWNAELMEQILHYDDLAPETAFRQLLGSYRCADEGNEAGALEHLEKALAATGSCPRVIRHAVFTDAATAAALARGNPVAARRWMARARKERKPISVHGVEAALAQSEGRYEGAVRSWDAALAFLAKRKLESGLARFSRRRIIEHREKCLEAIRSAETAGLRAQATGV